MRVIGIALLETGRFVFLLNLIRNASLHGSGKLIDEIWMKCRCADKEHAV